MHVFVYLSRLWSRSTISIIWKSTLRSVIVYQLTISLMDSTIVVFISPAFETEAIYSDAFTQWAKNKIVRFEFQYDLSKTLACIFICFDFWPKSVRIIFRDKLSEFLRKLISCCAATHFDIKPFGQLTKWAISEDLQHAYRYPPPHLFQENTKD